MSQDDGSMKKVSFPSSKTGPLEGNLYLKQLPKATGGSSPLSLKDRDTAGLFTPRGRRNSQGAWSLRTHVLLQTAPMPTQHHKSRHLSGAHRDAEAPETMLLESERTSTDDDDGGRTAGSDLGPNGLLNVNHITVLFGHSQHFQYLSLVGK